MVKPPKNMEPESVDLKKAGRAAGKAFQEDSFRNYMARKIDLQRQQFGLELPPDPRLVQQAKQQQNHPFDEATLPSHNFSPKKGILKVTSALPTPKKSATRGESGSRKRNRVTFAEGVKKGIEIQPKKKKKRKKKGQIGGILKKLRRRHGRGLRNNTFLGKTRNWDEIDDAENRIEEDVQLETLHSKELSEACASTKDTSEPCSGVSDEVMEDVQASSSSPPELREDQDALVDSLHAEGEVVSPNYIGEANSLCSDQQTQVNDFYENDNGIDDDDDKEFGLQRQEPFQSIAIQTARLRRERPDLFFLGVVAMVNGYTNPDTETIQRLLHKHGGDLEKYETSRITHIIAEHISTAKANIYKRQKRPTPVVSPKWIVDCVQAGQLLEYADYLIDEVKGINVANVKKFFASKSKLREKASPDIGSHQLVGSETQLSIHKRTGSSTGEEVADNLRNESLTHSYFPSNDQQATHQHSTAKHSSGRTDDKFINGRIRTVGTDPYFLESFFNNSRLSFIGSYKQRIQESPSKQSLRVANRSKGPRQRFVFHADMDCFFAAVVLRNYPQYQNMPVAISHLGTTATESSGHDEFYKPKKNSSSECATCNYEARKFGIRKGMFLGRAKQLCPNLVVLPYDFDGYEEVSEQVNNILHRFSIEYDGEVEQVSCDESYMELFFQSDDGLRDPVCRAGEIASSIRREIFEATRCTATIGVGVNKFLAKVATDRVKPNGSFVIRNHTELLRHLQLKDLYGIGYRTWPKLANEGLVSIQDVWDLGDAAESTLIDILGNGLGKKILGFCRGEDDRPVKATERKTIGAECNYGVRFDGPYGVDYMIAGLSKEVQKRMESVGVRGSRVTLKLKQRKKGALPPPKFLGHGSCHNLSKSSDIPGGHTSDWKVVSRICQMLLTELKVDTDDIRGMGITMSKLDTNSGDVRGDRKANQSITNWIVFYGEKRASARQEQDHKKTEGDCLEEGSRLLEDKELSGSLCDSAACPEQHAVSNPLFRRLDPATFRESNEEIKHELQRQRCNDLTMPDGEQENDEGVMLAIGLSQECFGGVKESADKAQTILDDSQPDSSFGDLALPPMSQIHLSQVEALPTPLKKQIQLKLADQNRDTERKPPKSTAVLPNEHGNAKLRQVSVKRMFRLAAVKSGNSIVGSAADDSICVKELEQLPLKMQLQIANNDTRGLGKISPSKPSTATSSSRRSKNVVVSRNARTNSTSNEVNECYLSSDTELDEGVELLVSFKEGPALENCVEERGLAPCKETGAGVAHTVDPGPSDFFHDDVAPLACFMDENPDVSSDALAQATEFLTLCVREKRLHDVVLLLRSIKNRRDRWGRHGYGQLLRLVDNTCWKLEGYRLDKEGLGL